MRKGIVNGWNSSTTTKYFYQLINKEALCFYKRTYNKNLTRNRGIWGFLTKTRADLIGTWVRRYQTVLCRRQNQSSRERERGDSGREMQSESWKVEREKIRFMQFHGPFGLRGEGARMEESRVELVKNRLILSQIYSTLFTLPPP